MKKIFLLVASAAMLFVACSEGIDESVERLSPGEDFTATFATTRTVMGDDGLAVNWVEGDQVSIFNKTTDNLLYKATNVDGGRASLKHNSGMRGEQTMTHNYAIFPYDSQASFESDKLYTTIAAEQTHNSETNLQHALMVAKSESNSFAFVNPAAIMRFDVKTAIRGTILKEIKVVASEDYTLAGDVVIDMAGADPVLTTLGSENTITLDCAETELTEDITSFYVALAPNEFEAGALKIVYTANFDGADHELEYPVNAALAIEPGMMRWTTFTVSEDFEGNTPTEPSDLERLMEILANGGEFVLRNNIVLTDQMLTVAKDVEVVLDLNGFTISREFAAVKGNTSLMLNNGHLTIKDSGVNGAIIYKDTQSYTADPGYASNVITNNGTLIIDGGRISNASTGDVLEWGYAHGIDNNAALTINNGTIESVGYSALRIWCTTDDNTITNINDGKFTGSIDMHNVNASANKGTLNISGGEFNQNTWSTKVVRFLNFGTTDVDEIDINISGGLFYGELGVSVNSVELNKVFNVTGGTYIGFDPAKCLAEDYGAWSENGTYYVFSPVVDGIANKGELYCFAEMVNSGNSFAGKTINLRQTIDLNNESWTPIGLDGDAVGFAGTFDGNTFAINNFKVDMTLTEEDEPAGLFGSLRGTVKNLTISGADIKNYVKADATVDGTAVVAGCTGYEGTIIGVVVTNSTVQSNRYVGGISGFQGGTIDGCQVISTVLTANQNQVNGGWDNGDKVGGILGYQNSTTSDVKNCSVKDITINGYRDLGGIAGYGRYNFTNCNAENVTINIILEDNYKNYTTADDFDASYTIGEMAADCQHTGEVTGTNTINYPVDIK